MRCRASRASPWQRQDQGAEPLAALDELDMLAGQQPLASRLDADNAAERLRQARRQLAPFVQLTAGTLTGSRLARIIGQEAAMRRQLEVKPSPVTLVDVHRGLHVLYVELMDSAGEQLRLQALPQSGLAEP